MPRRAADIDVAWLRPWDVAWPKVAWPKRDYRERTDVAGMTRRALGAILAEAHERREQAP